MSRLSGAWSLHGPWLTAGLGSLALVGFLYRLWEVPLGLPFSYAGDALPNAMLYKSIIETGDIWSNPRLAAPFVQHYQDWPLTDLLPLYVGKLLTIFSSNWAAILNMVYLLTYPAVGFTSWWVMRKLGVSPWVAAALSIVYAIAPYHLRRQEMHFFLAGYYGAPLGVWLAVSLMDGKALFTKKSSAGGVARLLSWNALRTVILCVVVATSSVYYTAFTVVMIGFVLGLCLVQNRWRVIAPGLVVTGLLVGTVALAGLPTLLHRAEVGGNAQVAERAPADTEVFGLKIAQMLLPVEGHRVAALAEIHKSYVATFPLNAEHAFTSLGFVASAGLVWLLGYSLYAIVGNSRPRWLQRHGQLSFLTIALLLTASIGGFSTLIAIFLTPQIRAWNRVSIILAFLALAALGLLYDRLRQRHERLRRRPVSAAVFALVIAFASFDQYSPAVASVGGQAAEAYFFDDAEFFGRVEAVLPEGASVFQLPVVEFPDPAITQYEAMGLYDHLRPYLHTDDLQWSFGGIEGRLESHWQLRLVSDKPDVLLPKLVAVGFDGLYIDRFAYAERAAELESAVVAVTGAEPLVSLSGRMSFFDLRAYGEALRASDPSTLALLRTRTLFPVIHQVYGRDYPLLEDDVSDFYWAPEDVVLPIVNEADRPQEVTVSFTLDAGNFDATYNIVWPDGSRQIVSGKVVPVSHSYLAPPGPSEVRIDSNVPLISGLEIPERSFRLRELIVAPSVVPLPSAP